MFRSKQLRTLTMIYLCFCLAGSPISLYSSRAQTLSHAEEVERRAAQLVECAALYTILSSELSWSHLASLGAMRFEDLAKALLAIELGSIVNREISAEREKHYSRYQRLHRSKEMQTVNEATIACVVWEDRLLGSLMSGGALNFIGAAEKDLRVMREAILKATVRPSPSEPLPPTITREDIERMVQQSFLAWENHEYLTPAKASRILREDIKRRLEEENRRPPR